MGQNMGAASNRPCLLMCLRWAVGAGVAPQRCRAPRGGQGHNTHRPPTHVTDRPPALSGRVAAGPACRPVAPHLSWQCPLVLAAPLVLVEALVPAEPLVLVEALVLAKPLLLVEPLVLVVGPVALVEALVLVVEPLALVEPLVLPPLSWKSSPLSW